MIHRIFNTDSRFKELAFKPGFNVLLAEKTPGARRDQSRNAAGKSSSLEIIHYALGSSSGKGSFFANEAFRGQTIGMAFDLSGETLRVHRPLGPEANRGKVFFTGDVPAYLQKELADGLSEEDRTLSIKLWNEILGRQVFAISPGAKFAPSFRMAFPYFCRLDSDGGWGGLAERGCRSSGVPLRSGASTQTRLSFFGEVHHFAAQWLPV